MSVVGHGDNGWNLCVNEKDGVPLRRHWLRTQCHAPPSWPAACPETQTSTNEQGVWLITSGSQSSLLPFSRVWLCACPAPLQTFPPDPTLLGLWFPIKSRRLLWFLPLIFFFHYFTWGQWHIPSIITTVSDEYYCIYQSMLALVFMENLFHLLQFCSIHLQRSKLSANFIRL